MTKHTEEAPIGPTEDIIFVHKAYNIDLDDRPEGWLMPRTSDGKYNSGELLVGSFFHNPKDIQSWTVVGKGFQ